MVQWKDEWVTGIEMIDTEHRRLIELLTKMENELENPSQYLQVELVALASEVTNHITNHFTHEEQIALQLLSSEELRNHSYAHRQWRQLLLRELGKVRMTMSTTTITDELLHAARQFVTSVYDFFDNHFSSHDCKFCEHRCKESQ